MPPLLNPGPRYNIYCRKCYGTGVTKKGKPWKKWMKVINPELYYA